MQPKINEMISFLKNYNSDELRNIRAQNLNFAEILEEGETLGEGNPSSGELKVRAVVCVAAAKAVTEECSKALLEIRKKLDLNKKIQLYGKIIATISGASLLTILSTDHNFVKYIIASLGLVSAIIPLIVDFTITGFNATQKLDNLYTELIKSKLEAESYQQELQFFIDNGFNEDKISEVIVKCNTLCRDIKEKLLNL